MAVRASWLLIALLLGSLPAHGADLPDPWVEVAANGALDVRAVTVAGSACPAVRADGRDIPSRTRGEPDGSYPLQVCVAQVPITTQHLMVDGIPAPVLPHAVRRVVVIGDTGCRLKGDFVQDCNVPAKWPFARIARLAAVRRPDLVIDVGDYHYRETPCPAGRPGCAGSPHGDNWEAWKRDFFDPAAPLLAAAPWVMSRGNHEVCGRGGQGWFRLLDPHPNSADCVATTTPYALNVGGLHLLMLDGADADDAHPDAAKVTAYREQLRTLLAEAPPHAWLVTHRPAWALAEGKGVMPGATVNATEQTAIRDLVPPVLEMVLSGHIHDFASYDFGASRPAQLVIGEGGDVHDEITQPVTAGAMLDGLAIRHGFTLPDYGYVLLHRTPTGWGGMVYSVADEVLARCRLHGRDVVCHAVEAPRSTGE